MLLQARHYSQLLTIIHMKTIHITVIFMITMIHMITHMMIHITNFTNKIIMQI